MQRVLLIGVDDEFYDRVPRLPAWVEAMRARQRDARGEAVPSEQRGLQFGDRDN